jgi:HSP20 family molecular chaperone IbpA
MTNGALTSWRPIDSIFEEFFNVPSTTNYSTKDWIFEKNKNGGTLTLNALGYNPEDIEIELINSKLTIKGNKPDNGPPLMKQLDYAFTLPTKYSEEDIKAHFNNGLVTIEFGMKEDVKPKKIKISY